MFRPPEMARVHALGSREVVPQVIETLHGLRALQPVEFREEEDFFERGDALEGASEASEELIKVRSLIDGLDVGKDVEGGFTRGEIEESLDERLPGLKEELSELTSDKEEVEKELEKKRELLEDVKEFSKLPLNFEDYSGYENLEVFLGYITAEPEISDAHRLEVFQTNIEEGHSLVALFVAEDRASEIGRALSEAGFQEVKPPLKEGSPEEEAARLEDEIGELERRLSELDGRLEEAREEFGGYLLAVEEYLSIEVEKKEFPLEIAESENTFVVDGWVPETQVDEVEEALTSVDERLHFEVVETVEADEAHGEEDADEEEEEPPVAYENPSYAAPFETFTEMFGRPSYREVDPTFMVFLAFPIIYGMMLGDVAYGIGSLAIASYLLKKRGAMRDLGYALSLAGVSAVVFGVAYAEFLGPIALGTEWAHFANEMLGFHALPLLERNLFAEHVQIPVLVMLSIWVGLVQVGGGFLLEFYNGLKSDHSNKEAVTHGLAWFLLIVGILGMITANYSILLMPDLPSSALYPTGGLTAVSLLLVISGEGAIGLMEIPSRIFSHTFSFTRIAAIGLSSVGIALVINMFAEIFIFEMGGVFVVVGALVYIFGHLANLVLGVFASTLHSIRLEWVEFFTKFYEGAGRKFRPFGRITKYLEET